MVFTSVSRQRPQTHLYLELTGRAKWRKPVGFCIRPRSSWPIRPSGEFTLNSVSGVLYFCCLSMEAFTEYRAIKVGTLSACCEERGRTQKDQYYESVRGK